MSAQNRFSFSLELSDETKAKLRSLGFDDFFGLGETYDDCYFYEIANERDTYHSFAVRFYIEMPFWKKGWGKKDNKVSGFSVSWDLCTNGLGNDTDQYPNPNNLSISDLIMDYLNRLYVEGMTDPQEIDDYYMEKLVEYVDSVEQQQRASIAICKNCGAPVADLPPGTEPFSLKDLTFDPCGCMILR
jgi:hypothetical protein